MQAVAETLLYYERVVNPTILPVLSSLATKQTKLTKKMMEMGKQLLDYCATQEETIITYVAIKMILCIHRDARYCNKRTPEAKLADIFSHSNNN